MARRTDRAVFAVFLLLLLPAVARAFPEAVRSGYPNCIACHQSPAGGGLLSPYGRSLAAEWASTWTSKGEERFAYLFEPTETINLGGDFRAIQIAQNRATRTNTQFIFMQADLEAALTVKKFSVDATAGLDYAGTPLSRRHYLMYRPTDEISFRGGRFLPSYGLNSENHSIVTRRGIGRDQATESYNLEGALIKDNFDLFVTGIFGRPDSPALGAESGGAVSASYFLGNGYKLGLSYFYGSRDLSQRHVMGPFGVLGFTKNFFLLVEVDFQVLSPKLPTTPSQSGVVDYLRLDYEVLRGLHFYLTQELAQLDFSNDRQLSDAYGIGAQWFPRPHFELNLLYLRQRFGSNSSYADFAFAMLHFYP